MATILIDNENEIGGSAEPKTEWSYLGQTTGNAEITIPDNATEVIGYATSSSATSVGYQFHFVIVQDDISYARYGYYASSNNYGFCAFGWTKNTRKAWLQAHTNKSTDYTASTITKWYIKN